MAKPVNRDRRVLMGIVGCLALAIAIVAIFAPGSYRSTADDPRPTTNNPGPAGAKAAFLLLSQLGYQPVRWTRPLREIDSVDASSTTLVLADPSYVDSDRGQLAEAIKSFLERGGHVLATGPAAARLLPDGDIAVPFTPFRELCHTTPEGPGPLARVGEVEMATPSAWKNPGPAVRVEHRCGPDAVVVRYSVGQGEVIWWAGATPLTNAGLKKDAGLRLFLASLGEGRKVIFDESLHDLNVSSYWSKLKDMPLGWLALQAALIAALLVLSFSRRRGPLRPLIALPRTSPVEFADSMGALYQKASATAAAAEAARRRLVRVLVREAGVSQATIELGPEALAESLTHRLGGDWHPLAEHLESAEEATSQALSPRQALALMQALSEDAATLRRKLRPGIRTSAVLQESNTETTLVTSGKEQA